MSISRRSWVAGIAGILVGSALCAADTVIEVFAIGPPSLHFSVECVEFLVMGPGLGAALFLLVERLRALRLAQRQQAERERERRLMVLGRLAAAVAHEVRNPLQTLRLIVDELRGEVPILRDHPLAAHIDANLERIDQAVQLVYRLARPGADEQTVVDLAAATREGLEQCAGRGGGPSRFTVVMLAAPAPVRVSLSGLRIIVDNLLRNALEAGGDAPVRVALAAGEGDYRLTVVNRGVLAERGASSLLEPAASGKPEGLGIGLAVARHIAADAGGAIELSQAGDEVRAELRLPRADPP